jgi:hypothetical protein
MVYGSIAGLIALAGCATFANSAVFKDGQLFCADATKNGPMIVAVENAIGIPVIVTGMESAAVASVCVAWNSLAIPVAPPAAASPATTPTVAVAIPATP